MTKLSTHIPIEYIKKSEKLQELDTSERWNEVRKSGNYKLFSKGMIEQNQNAFYGMGYSAPTIADIIDNAEELFILPRMKNTLSGKMIKVVDNKYQVFYKMAVDQIIVMCQQNKPIEEISQYILDNIK